MDQDQERDTKLNYLSYMIDDKRNKYVSVDHTDQSRQST